MATASAGELAVRLDRLPMTRHIWVLVTLISLGGAFEFYDLFLTAYIAPGLLKAGYFTPESLGPVQPCSLLTGWPGSARSSSRCSPGCLSGRSFSATSRTGCGRRSMFTFSLIWYSLATAAMAFQNTGRGVDPWRFIAAIGVGLEQVTIDTYLTEFVPAKDEGELRVLYPVHRVFCSFRSSRCWAGCSFRAGPFGLDGWRWVALFAAVGAIVGVAAAARLCRKAPPLARAAWAGGTMPSAS